MSTLSDHPEPRVVTDLSVAHALAGTEVVLTVRGLGQGVLGQDPGGPVCTVGAVIVAVAGPGGIAAWLDARMTEDDEALVNAACDALACVIGLPVDFHHTIYVEEWNDRAGRTLDEVLAVVRKAREISGGVPPKPLDLHADLHPQPGDEPAAPLPPGVEGFRPGRAS